MPDTATVEVRMPDGKVWTIPKESLVRAKLRGAVEYTAPAQTKKQNDAPAKENSLESHARSFNEGATGFGDLQQMWKGLKSGFTKLREEGPVSAFSDFVQDQLDTQSEAVGKRQYSDPNRYVAAVPLVGPGLARASEEGGTKGLSRIAGMGVGGSILSKTGELPGKAAVAAEDLLQAGKKVPPKVVQNVTGAKMATNRAETAAAESAAEKRSAYEKRVSEATADFETRKAKQDAAHEAKVAEAKAKHEAQLEATKRGYGESVSQAERAKIAESRLEGQKRSLSDLKDRYSEQAAENLEKAEGGEKASLDKRYQDFREKVLGVSKENPNGLLHADLSQMAQSIIDARKNVLKGSKTSVPIFNDVLGRIKNIVQETPEGELKLVEGQQMIPVDQLRGYLTEINDALYERDLPNDVRNALKEVQKAGEAQVSSAIKDAHGQGAVGLYDKLKGDYSDYMDTWRDTQSGSPLPAIRKLLKSPIAQKRGVPVYREVGRILEGTKGEKAIATVARKKGFGADPGIIAKLRAADKRLEGLPKSAGKIPVVKRPNFPQYKEPMAPAPVERKNVEHPEIEPFNRQAFMRNTIEDRLNWAGKLGQGYKILQMINDVVHMKGWAAASEAEQMAMIEAIKRALTSDKALNYFSKEN